jgi:predicted metal-dependent phosphotriesterase family hydrolase
LGYAGRFSPAKSLGEGKYRSEFTAPSVEANTTCIIQATAGRAGYIGCAAQALLTISTEELSLRAWATADKKEIRHYESAAITVHVQDDMMNMAQNATVSVSASPSNCAIVPSDAEPTGEPGEYWAVSSISIPP